MKIVGWLSFLLLFSPNIWAQNEADLIKKVKAKLEKVSDYQAAGKMNIDVSFIKAPASSVTVYYKKPNRFKVVKQHGISILPKGGVSVNLNSLLLTDNYTVVPTGTALINGTTTKVVKLLPQDENGDVVLTTLYIDEKNLVIKRSSVTTRESGSYQMDLEYGKYTAWGLPDKVVFSFNTKDYKLPKGVTFEYEKGDAPKQPPLKKERGKVEIRYSDYTINKGINDAVFKDAN